MLSMMQFEIAREEKQLEALKAVLVTAKNKKGGF